MNKTTTETKSLIKKKPFWKLHFLSLFLILLLIISVAWGYFGKQIAISNYKDQLEQLKVSQQDSLTKLKEENVRQLSNTLALAIRSSMIDENMSQIGQYFNQSLSTFKVEKFMLADQNNGKIIISTNKKDEDEIFGDQKILTAKEAILQKYDNHTYVSTPIMGLNTQLAVLIIQLD